MKEVLYANRTARQLLFCLFLARQQRSSNDNHLVRKQYICVVTIHLILTLKTRHKTNPCGTPNIIFLTLR